MNSFAIVFLAALAIANAGILVPSAKILQGPSSRTTVIGPDGSAISAVAPGGRIVTDEQVGVVAQTVPAALAAPAIAAPGLIAAPGVIAARSLVAPGLVGLGGLGGLGDTIVAGPSGTIATRGALGVPGLVSPLASAAIW